LLTLGKGLITLFSLDAIFVFRRAEDRFYPFMLLACENKVLTIGENKTTRLKGEQTVKTTFK